MSRMNRVGLFLIATCLVVGCDRLNRANRSKTSSARLAKPRKVTIGTLGASIEVQDDWQRKKLNADFGDDQFILSDNGVFGMAVIELRESFDSHQELHTAIDEWTAGFDLVGTDFSAKRRPVKQTNGMDHASTQVNVTVQGIDLTYELHILGRDGLYYLIMNWTPSSGIAQLRKKSAAITRSLTLPGEESEWGRSTKTVQATVSSRGYTLRFPYQKSIFIKQTNDLGDALFALAGRGGRTNCYWFLAEGFDSTEEASEAIFSVIEPEYPEIVMKSRKPVRVAGRDASQSIYEVNDRDAPFSVLSTVIPLANDTFLEVRCLTSTALKGKLKYFNPLIEQLVIDAPSQVDAFPEVAQKQSPDPLGPHEQKLLQAAQRVGQFEKTVTQYVGAPDGSILAIGPRAIAEINAKPGQGNREAVALVDFEEWGGNRSAAVFKNQLLATDTSGAVTAIHDGVRKPRDFKATRLCRAGASSLLVVRTKPVPDRLQLLNAAVELGSQLLLRQADGTERTLGEFQAIERLACSDAGDWALLQERIDPWKVRLILVDLKTGSQTPVVNWKSVTHLAATESGWLVNGQPDDGLLGLYRLDQTGKHELLISGFAFTGIRLADNSLLCASHLMLEPSSDETAGAAHIYSIPLDVVRSAGPGCLPFDGRLIQSIARQAVDELKLDLDDPALFTTKKQVDAFLKRAQAISEKTAGFPLPSDAEAFDRLIGSLSDGESLSREGLLLLSLNLVSCLIESGAEWVDGERSVLAIRHGRVQNMDRENPLVVAYMVDDVIMSTLYDGEGWWNPAKSIVDLASGRTILLGSDPVKLREAYQSRNQDDLNQLIEQGAADALVEFLRKRADNLHLRQHVYDALVKHNRLAACLKIADTFAELPDAKLVDVKYRVVLNFERGVYQSKSRVAIGELRSYIEQFPTEATFYLVLGAVYEGNDKGDPDIEREKARLCYVKAIELRRWGAVYQQATDALIQLSDAAK